MTVGGLAVDWLIALRWTRLIGLAAFTNYSTSFTDVDKVRWYSGAYVRSVTVAIMACCYVPLTTAGNHRRFSRRQVYTEHLTAPRRFIRGSETRAAACTRTALRCAALPRSVHSLSASQVVRLVARATNRREIIDDCNTCAADMSPSLV